MTRFPEPDYAELERRFTERFRDQYDVAARMAGALHPNDPAWRDERALAVAERVAAGLTAVEQRWNAARQAEATMRLQGLFQRQPVLPA